MKHELTSPFLGIPKDHPGAEETPYLGGQGRSLELGGSDSFPLLPPGQTCEVDINECVKSPCRHSASCQNTNGSYRCHCQAGYTGRNCETDIDDCRPSEWASQRVHV